MKCASHEETNLTRHLCLKRKIEIYRGARHIVLGIGNHKIWTPDVLSCDGSHWIKRITTWKQKETWRLKLFILTRQCQIDWITNNITALIAHVRDCMSKTPYVWIQKILTVHVLLKRSWNVEGKILLCQELDDTLCLMSLETLSASFLHNDCRFFPRDIIWCRNPRHALHQQFQDVINHAGEFGNGENRLWIRFTFFWTIDEAADSEEESSWNKTPWVRNHDGTLNATFSFVGSGWPNKEGLNTFFSSDFVSNESIFFRHSLQSVS